MRPVLRARPPHRIWNTSNACSCRSVWARFPELTAASGRRSSGTATTERVVIVFPQAVSDWVATIGRTEFLPIGNFPASAPGTILFMNRDGGDKVQFDLRLFNRAAPQSAWGTKLPVVREREFAEAVSLINVPTSVELRSALRVYGLPDSVIGEGTVVVQIYSNDERLLASSELSLKGWPRYGAILSLAEAFPEIRQVDRVRVLVQSRAGVNRIWAFVSVVANATQEVALVTPD